ncbi:AsnC family protein [Clostridium diolis]|uniref:HTH asnC-type domain-containing protein n=1 Tax=Clostridium diolis TaxID=223919 RepID=A0AAV3W3X5_9CLOT|nr:AsnC family protein [Clostridium diolis]GEA32928.1 hypothetical protein CDIOL_38510 [Clostridium diolis]
MFDEIDLKILDILLINSKIPLKEIGEHVHLTPQNYTTSGFRYNNTVYCMH